MPILLSTSQLRLLKVLYDLHEACEQHMRRTGRRPGFLVVRPADYQMLYNASFHDDSIRHLLEHVEFRYGQHVAAGHVDGS